jgi:hypothetical protein
MNRRGSLEGPLRRPSWDVVCLFARFFESLFRQRFKRALSDEVLCFPDDDPPVVAQLIL